MSGRVAEEEPAEARPWRVLVVCTGNTCRSPMAAALLARAAREAACPVRVVSAGVGAWEGDPASGGAVRAVRRFGEDITGHRSRPLAPGDVLAADLVLTMTRAQRAMVRLLVPEARRRVFTMEGFARSGWRGEDGEDAEVDVPDPLGNSDEEYGRTAERLWSLARGVVRWLRETPGPVGDPEGGGMDEDSAGL